MKQLRRKVLVLILAQLRKTRDEEGFSLLEIMIVIALIALFAILVGPPVLDMFAQGQGDAALVQIKQLEQSVKLYYRNCGRYPTTAQGLEALITPSTDCKRWRKTLDTDAIPDDPWGNAYLYYSPGVRSQNDFEIISRGSNTDDDSDDVTSFTRPEQG